MSPRCWSRVSPAPSRRGGCSRPRSARTSRARTTRRWPISTRTTWPARSRSRNARRSPRSPRRASLSDSARVEHQLDVRYIGQEYTLTIPLTHATEPTTDTFAESNQRPLRRGSRHALWTREPGRPDRVRGRTLDRPRRSDPRRRRAPNQDPKPPPPSPRQRARSCSAAVSARPKSSNATICSRAPRTTGPAVIIEATATTVVPPECKARIDDFGTIVIEIGEEA